MRKLMIIGVGAAFAASAMAGPIQLNTVGVAHTENFDTLINGGSTGGGSIPINAEIVNAQFWTGTAGPAISSGWWNGSGTTFGSASDGTAAANSNRIISYGANGVAERALGLGWREVAGNNISVIGAQIQNNTGGAITDLNISYDGELWYTGPAAQIGAADTLRFEYSLNAASVKDGAATWTAVSTLNFTAPTTGKGQFSAWDGNNAANRVAGISDTISSLSIADGANFFIRWYIPDTANGGTHGQGIDNFSIQAVPEPATFGLLGVFGIAITAIRRRFVA